MGLTVVCLLLGRGVSGVSYSLKRHYKRLLVALTALSFQLLALSSVSVLWRFYEGLATTDSSVQAIGRAYVSVHNEHVTPQIVWLLVFSSLLLSLQVRFSRAIAPLMVLVQALAVLSLVITRLSLLPFVALTVLYIAVVPSAPRFSVGKIIWMVRPTHQCLPLDLAHSLTHSLTHSLSLSLCGDSCA